MNIKLPNPYMSSGQYQGLYARPAFGLLHAHVPVNDHLFGALKKHGLRVQDIKGEGGNTGDTTLVYDLPAVSTIVRVRLDMLDITCANMLAIGHEQTLQIVIDCWNALQAADNSVEPVQHMITRASQFRVTDEVYKKVLGLLVNTPKNLAREPESGVVFYFPAGSREGDQGGNVVLDRLGFNSGVLNIRVGMSIDAKKIELSALRSYVDEYVNNSLSMLGIEA
jgi:hypothetical protein